MDEGWANKPIITDGAGPTRVFVYGSLKRQQANHAWLDGAAWLGEAQLAGLELFDLGPFPMAVASPGETALLHGELYLVSGPMLERLDRFEGAPRLFQRHWLELWQGPFAWVYLGRARQVRHSPLVASGRWQGAR